MVTKVHDIVYDMQWMRAKAGKKDKSFVWDIYPGYSGRKLVNINVAFLLDLVKGIVLSVFAENVTQFYKIDESTWNLTC